MVKREQHERDKRRCRHRQPAQASDTERQQHHLPQRGTLTSRRDRPGGGALGGAAAVAQARAPGRAAQPSSRSWRRHPPGRLRRPATQPAAASRSLTWDPEVELTADLRDVPTDKLATRIRHVLDQVSREVTLIVWIHDRPDATPVLPVIYQELRAAGYYSDTTRLPQGGQRMRISRRRWRQAACATEPRQHRQASTAGHITLMAVPCSGGLPAQRGSGTLG